MAITIHHDGDTWRLLSEGATRDGRTYCHLASTTRVCQQKNGSVPVQISDWISNAVILSAAIQSEEAQRSIAAKKHLGACVPRRGRGGDLGACIYCGEKPDSITAYYADRAASGQAVLTAHR